MSPRQGFGRICAVLGVTAGLCVGVGGVFPASAATPEGAVQGAGSANAVPGSYLVVLKPQAAAARSVAGGAQGLARAYGGKVRRTYDAALKGFSAELSARDARRLAADPSVALVSQNRRVRLDGVQSAPDSWGLDRIDQRRFPFDNRYTYPDSAGRGVTAYIVDTGVRVTQEEFDGRASYGYDAIDGDDVAEDGHGHGTHVAGTVASSVFGVAKSAKIVAVRVLNDDGEGTTEQVVAGIDWVTQHAAKPAVVNMSLGGDPDPVLDAAVANSIATGLTYAVAAGNGSVDAAEHSPARVPTALTVGATDSDDRQASFSNYGPLVDLFAPGVDIVSTANWSDYGGFGLSMSGTSMASPHVAGAAALYLSDHPGATPAQVAAALTASATTGSVVDAGPGSPDRLLYTGTVANRPRGPLFAGTTPVVIDGKAAFESPVTVSGVSGKAPKDLEIQVDIEHGWSGDLRVELVAPNGTVFLLREEKTWAGGSGITGIFGVDASACTANGVWRLRVTDVYGLWSGAVKSWALRF
ncbi:S8 family peptidase [Kitasatospora sp. RG8]|uniref:S8 family peptidase n=1 Tax=Kitasatospora sp. RG8 TaxID=2820815 RepID=UPI001ADFEFD7|nr:S8 family peptidase [Kitasatospora sp. RG8]MBP0449108.1 S8 family peptidase [Kitasatospora sp. RG8]